MQLIYDDKFSIIDHFNVSLPVILSLTDSNEALVGVTKTAVSESIFAMSIVEFTTIISSLGSMGSVSEVAGSVDVGFGSLASGIVLISLMNCYVKRHGNLLIYSRYRTYLVISLFDMTYK